MANHSINPCTRAAHPVRRSARTPGAACVLSGTFAIAFLSYSAGAAAQTTPPPPTVVSQPMVNDGTARTNVGSQPMDLPAPETTSWVNKPLLITGSALLVAGYVPALVVSQISDRPNDQDDLIYPVVGPWMNLMDRGCDERACSDENLNTVLLVAGGVSQGVGALSMLLSLVLPGKTTQNWYLIGGDTKVAPMYVGNSTYGLGASGRF